MVIGLGLALVSLLGTPTTPDPTSSTATDPVASEPDPPTPEEMAPPLYPPPPAPPPIIPSAPPPPRRYGDRGSSEIALGLGYSSDAGLLAAGGFWYFLLDGIAPGVDTTYVGGGNQVSSFGLVLGSLRLVPIRSSGFALVLTGRGGRVIMSDHIDGWGVGGGGGVIVFLGSNFGLEIGYEALRLVPASFCADLLDCVIHGPVFGLRLSF